MINGSGPAPFETREPIENGSPLIVESEAEQLLGEKSKIPPSISTTTEVTTKEEPLVEELETEGVLEEDDENAAAELRNLLDIEEEQWQQ